MDTLLIAVTVLSLTMAIGLAILTTRLLREDRARAEARIAALTQLSAEPELEPPPALLDEPLPVTTPDGFVVEAPSIFAARVEESPWGRRLAIAGALAVVVSAGIFAAHAAGPSAPPAAAAAPAPLELTALRYTRDAQGLTVSGSIQNPASGVPLSGVVATVYVFGPGGAFLTSGRAPVAASALAPGGDSPFQVTLPVNGEVARYRVGFRTADGAVVAHVDRRSSDTVASTQEQP
ncbi:MAG: hypothetical protein ABI603_03415 [Acidobacteriota bacterium]